jgi:hypothetical protein
MTDCEYTRAKLEKLGVTCAPINRKLIETYVRAGVREGYFPRAPRVENHDTARAPEDFPTGLLGAQGSLS